MGHNNFLPGRSHLNAGIDPQKLLDGAHAGEFPVVGYGSRGQPIVDFGKKLVLMAHRAWRQDTEQYIQVKAECILSQQILLLSERNHESFPNWLVLCVWRALIGEIYPAIRAIAISLSDDGGELLIRYYLDRPPTDLDWESLEVVATNISASIGQDKISHVDLDCKFVLGSLGCLECLDGFIYCRREYDL